MTLDSVPVHHLEQFRIWAEQSLYLDNTQKSLIVGMIDSAQFDSELYRKFKEYIDLLDNIRGTDYFSVFPQAKI